MSESKRLLIVEDERIVAMDLRRRLEAMGHTIVGSVANGRDAIELAVQEKPDLVLMDIRIEGPIDGVDTARILREKHHIAHVYLTAHSDEATIQRAKLTEPDGYVTKPFNDRDIKLNIEIALHKARMREELRVSELKFRTLIQNSSDLILQLGKGGIISYISPSVQRILGYRDQEVIGKSALDFIHKEDTHDLIALLKFSGLLGSGSGGRADDPNSLKGVVRIRHKDGSMVHVELIGTLIDHAELPRSVVLNGRDISERLRFEQELRQAKIIAEEMNRMKSTFLSNISHELRTPLTGIIGFASILELELEGEFQEMAENIHKSGQRLLDTMEAVMDLALIESNKIEKIEEPVVLSEEVQQAVRLLTGLAFEKDLRMKIVARNEPPQIKTDKRLLGQILHNVIGNAIKFTEKGGVTITIDQGIYQHGNGREKFAMIQVKDTGIGISSEFLPHIFDEFKQESSGTTRKFDGTGIGLAITKRMVDILDGDIEVQSATGKGSTFTIRLPLNGST